MTLTEIFQSLGEERFRELMKTISISRLKTYQLYESLKTRAHLPKLNTQGLKKVTPKFWERLNEGDEDLAADLAQAILVGKLDLIIDVLDFLGIPHSEGFFEKDLDASETLTGEWQQKAYDEFKDKYPEAMLVFYLNHLAWEVTKDKPLFQPAGVA